MPWQSKASCQALRVQSEKLMLGTLYYILEYPFPALSDWPPPLVLFLLCTLRGSSKALLNMQTHKCSLGTFGTNLLRMCHTGATACQKGNSRWCLSESPYSSWWINPYSPLWGCSHLLKGWLRSKEWSTWEKMKVCSAVEETICLKGLIFPLKIT